MFQILALYLEFEGAKNIHVLWVTIWTFEAPDLSLETWLQLDMATDLWFNHVPKFGSLSWFLRCKEDSCPQSHHLGVWRMLKVLDWGLASWSWFGYGHWSLVDPCSKFWLCILILKVQRTSLSFKSWFGVFGDSGGSSLGFGILILIWILSGTLLFLCWLYLNFELIWVWSELQGTPMQIPDHIKINIRMQNPSQEASASYKAPN